MFDTPSATSCCMLVSYCQHHDWDCKTTHHDVFWPSTPVPSQGSKERASHSWLTILRLAACHWSSDRTKAKFLLSFCPDRQAVKRSSHSLLQSALVGHLPRFTDASSRLRSDESAPSCTDYCASRSVWDKFGSDGRLYSCAFWFSLSLWNDDD